MPLKVTKTLWLTDNLGSRIHAEFGPGLLCIQVIYCIVKLSLV